MAAFCFPLSLPCAYEGQSQITPGRLLRSLQTNTQQLGVRAAVPPRKSAVEKQVETDLVLSAGYEHGGVWDDVTALWGVVICFSLAPPLERAGETPYLSGESSLYEDL